MSLGTSFSFNNVKEISLVKMTTASDKEKFWTSGWNQSNLLSFPTKKSLELTDKSDASSTWQTYKLQFIEDWNINNSSRSV